MRSPHPGELRRRPVRRFEMPPPANLLPRETIRDTSGADASGPVRRFEMPPAPTPPAP